MSNKRGLRLDLKRVFDERCATVLFLLEDCRDPSFYLAQKKQDIHTDQGEVLSGTRKWNGYGGKWKSSDRTIFDTAARELFDESLVRVKKEDLTLVARIEFFWPKNTTGKRDMEVFFFTAIQYSGDPQETPEMGSPKLFSVHTAPYGEMLPADEDIIRKIMYGNTVEGQVYFEKRKGENVVRSSNLIVSPLYR
jgi:NUDIX domain